MNYNISDDDSSPRRSPIRHRRDISPRRSPIRARYEKVENVTEITKYEKVGNISEEAGITINKKKQWEKPQNNKKYVRPQIDKMSLDELLNKAKNVNESGKKRTKKKKTAIGETTGGGISENKTPLSTKDSKKPLNKTIEELKINITELSNDLKDKLPEKQYSTDDIKNKLNGSTKISKDKWWNLPIGSKIMYFRKTNNSVEFRNGGEIKKKFIKKNTEDRFFEIESIGLSFFVYPVCLNNIIEIYKLPPDGQLEFETIDSKITTVGHILKDMMTKINAVENRMTSYEKRLIALEQK